MLFIAGPWVCVCASLRVLLSLSISVSVSVTIFVSVLVFVPRRICMTGRPSGLPRVFGALELAEQTPARGANPTHSTRLRCGHPKFLSDRRVILFALELYCCSTYFAYYLLATITETF